LRRRDRRTRRRLLDRHTDQAASPGAHAPSHQELLDEITGSDAWLRLIWESAPDAMALSDPDGTVLMVNPAYCALYGYPREEVVGHSFAVIFPPEHRQAAAEQYRQIFAAGGGIPIVETWTRRNDGAERFVQARAELLLQDGQPRAMLSIIRDITERKRAEEALQEREARFQLALTLAPVMVFTQDTELRYTWAHSSIPAGPDAGAIIGKTDADLLPPDEATALTALKRRVLEDGERVHGEASLTLGTAPYDISFVIAPLHDSKGTITGLIGASVDISDYRTLERRQRQFIAMAAHELRTPVTSILGFAQLVQRRQPQDRQIATIVRQAASLDRLINDLIDSARLEDGDLEDRRPELRREHFDLVELAQDIAEQIQPLSEAHPIRVDAPAEPLVGCWDRERLGQVIQNLLINAIKYSPGGCEIVISFEDLGEEVGFAVRDQGVGIPPGVLPRIFDAFYRVERTSRMVRGLGLGLHISRSLVEAHGGQIVAESAGEWTGSTFTVTLPRQPGAETA
jgi:PAS domain S-box-containing protein